MSHLGDQWKFVLAHTPNRGPAFQQPVNLVAYDGFNQTSGNLSGKTLDSGQTWGGSGDADDFTVTGSGELQRTATLDLNFPIGRVATVGATNYSSIAVQIDYLTATGDAIYQGVIARYTDTDNYLYAIVRSLGVSSPPASITIGKRVSGSGTTLLTSTQITSNEDTWYTIRMQVVGGDIIVWQFPRGTTNPGKPFVISGDTDLSGGALTTGLHGITDVRTDGSADTRRMDNFLSFIPSSASVSFSKIGEITQATGKTLTWGLNQAGSGGFTVPLIDPIAYEIEPLTTSLLAYRGNSLLWSGPVWTVSEDAASERMNVSAIGWLEYLNHRLLRNKIVYTDQNDWDIARALFLASDSIFSLPFKIGTTSGSAQVRTRQFEQWTNIGSAIQELSQIENGFDYEVDPATLALNFYRSKGSTLPNVIFGYGWGPNNVQSVTRNIDAARLVNYVAAQGKHTTGEAPPETPNSASQLLYGLFEQSASLSDVVDVSILLAYAGAEVLYLEHPLQTFDFTPIPYVGTKRVPRAFTDYNLGDIVYLTVKKGRLDVANQAIRIFGLTISIDENGVERVSQIRSTAQ